MPTNGIDLRGIGTAEELRAALDLSPHPEGGWYRETWRDVPTQPGTRGAGTVILFLLAADDISAWHRIDAAEIWLWHAGAALHLKIVDDDRRSIRLGPCLDRGEQLQAVVPARAWQSAASTGEWTLVSCVVAPAFDFAGFELASNDPWLGLS